MLLQIQVIQLLKRNNFYLKKNTVHIVKNMVISFKHAMGAEAVKKLLQDIDLEKEVEVLERRIKDSSRTK